MSFMEFSGIQDPLLPRLATGFGGGIGRKGSVCGAVTGSVMAIGMEMGRTDPKDTETLSRVYGTCQRFWERFGQEFGSHLCQELTGVHLEDEEARREWLAQGGREKCTALVEKTARVLCELLNEPV